MDEVTPEPERWLPVVGWEGLYEVSDVGRVRSLPRNTTRGKVLRPGSVPAGYPAVNLHKAGDGGRTRTIHTLMAAAFIGPRPPGQYVRHLDDVKTHNVLSNLAYGPPRANTEDMIRNHGHPQANKTHCPAGHEYTPENTYNGRSRVGGAKRGCRICLDGQKRAYKAKKKAERAALTKQ
jgi:hypothetical protein